MEKRRKKNTWLYTYHLGVFWNWCPITLYRLQLPHTEDTVCGAEICLKKMYSTWTIYTSANIILTEHRVAYRISNIQLIKRNTPIKQSLVLSVSYIFLNKAFQSWFKLFLQTQWEYYIFWEDFNTKSQQLFKYRSKSHDTSQWLLLPSNSVLLNF